MNSRERVQTALRFERPDRLPANESPWEQTAAAWYDQGIPPGYGKRLAFYGNIDATKMAGPESLIREELMRKIPVARDGGYIFHSDHSCPPDVSLKRYQWILDTARSIFDGGT